MTDHASFRLDTSAAAQALRRHCDAIGDTGMRDLFAADATRFARFSCSADGLLLDYSKQRVTSEVMAGLLALADEAGLKDGIAALLAGEAVNFTEGRAALHCAARQFAATPAAARAECITSEMLDTYCSDNTSLGVHPERLLKGVDFGTGSLGMGISYAAGAALAAKMQNSKRRVFALVSDAECNEGIVWETAIFAAHHKISNLYVIIDLNGQQVLGYTQDVLDTSPLGKKWESFGWQVKYVDGHSREEIINAIQSCEDELTRPHVLIAHTVFGKGVSFMENKIKWHYWPMSMEEYELALQNVERHS